VRWLVAILVLAAVVAAALPIDDQRDAPAESRQAAPPEPSATPAPKRRDVRKARCREGVPGCQTVRGTVIYVERVDPDGDGDAHFVLVDPHGITAPRLSVIDVERDLRPDPLPGPGDLLSAAGPVYTGSYGQRQIQATELRFARITGLRR
jgi:hypothetical protein